MKKVLYHGTTADHLKDILKCGIKANTNKVWNCSENAVYFWDVERLSEAEGYEDLSEEDKQRFTFNRAFDSAQCAMASAKQCKAIVIKVEVNAEDIMIDDSCPNMGDSGAVCVYRDISINEIVSIHGSNDLSSLRGYFICLMAEREYCNLEFTPFDLKLASIFSKCEIYPEDIDDIVTWKQIYKR